MVDIDGPGATVMPVDDLYWQANLRNLRALSAYFWAYALFLMSIFGLVGNALSFVIFIKRRNYDKTSASYLTPLAFFDFINSIQGLNMWVNLHLENLTNGAFTIRHLSNTDFGCKVLSFSWTVPSFISSWIVVAFNVERCLVVWFPLKMNTVLKSSKHRAIGLAAIIISGCTWYSLPVIWVKREYYPPQQRERSACPLGSDAPNWVRYIRLALVAGMNAALPCAIICITNMFILVGIHRNEKEIVRTSKNDNRILVNLFLISTAFVLTVSPFAVMRIIYKTEQFDSYSKEAATFYGELELYATTLMFVNYFVNPIFYTFSLPYYRKELRKIFNGCGYIDRKSN